MVNVDLDTVPQKSLAATVIVELEVFSKSIHIYIYIFFFCFKRLMTDRTIMNSTFNKFAHWLETVIPFVIENYQSFSDNQKKNISNMHHVFCGLQVLHNLGIYSEKAILEWEEIEKRKVVPMGDLKPQIVGHIIFCLKSSSYCPIVMGIRKGEKQING